MKIIFEESTDNGYIEYYAISQLEVYKGKAHDELLWCELRQVGDKRWRVLWESDWSHPVFIDGSLTDAKDYVLKNYTRFQPHINGTSFNIDEL